MATEVKKMVADAAKAVTRTFSDSQRKLARQLGFADNDMSLDALLKSAPSAAEASPADVSDLGSLAAATSPGSEAATADTSAEGKKEEEKHEAEESPAQEKAEEEGTKESPKALIEAIKKIVEGADVAKAVKSKGEQAMAKLEELVKAVEDARSFISENPAPVEGVEGAPKA